ncbi:MAG: prepilin-type N-terminal cleavage/methylation domain-containing protein [Deltaproteobacteria bacterium]|nr:prepilin-type N-terminal cleavage/methylation domain-containing protein [Deltaproteobacteria bacterium]
MCLSGSFICHLISDGHKAVQKSFRASVKPQERGKGFTLIEIIIVMAILSILSAIAIPAYSRYIEKTRITKAIAEIKILSQEINGFKEDNNDTLPATLNAIGRAALLDPWGNPYQYLNYATTHGVGHIRKDRSLHPLNSDYDLYSMGKDGRSAPPITAHISQDDIIRANDGRFIGLAADY